MNETTLISMKYKNKPLFLVVLLFILFGLPVVSAQNNAPAGQEGVQSTVSEKTYKVKMDRKPFFELVKSGGMMMIPLGLLAMYGFYCAGSQWYEIRANKRSKINEFVYRLDSQSMTNDQIREAVQDEKKKNPRAVLPQIVEIALNREDKAGMTEALEDEGALHLSRIKRENRRLQGVVMVAPLLGLLGTVYGMISSFQSMGVAGDDKVKFLSEGIYEALVTTATGLTIAIPFLFFYLWLNRKTDEVGEDLNRQARGFMKVCATGHPVPVSGMEENTR